jgi:transcriptional regulator with XRE-family HTH domain
MPDVDTSPTSSQLERQAVLRAQVGSRIRSRRILVGLDAHLFAQAIGVPIQMVDEFECGAVRVDPNHLFRIASVLGASIGFFFQRDQS